MKKKWLFRYILILIFSLSSLMGSTVSIEKKIMGLYVAYVDRAPDQKGFSYWRDRAKSSNSSSTTLKELSAGFAQHPTFITTYGHLNNREFVEKIYKNSLGQTGNKDGINYWTEYLNSGKSRSDMVSDFVEASLTGELTKENFPHLTDEELIVAQARHDLIANKIEIGLKFIELLGDKSNVQDSQHPQNDPAYLASIKILDDITSDKSTVSNTINFLESIKNDSDPIARINNRGNDSTTTKPITITGYIIDEPIKNAHITLYSAYRQKISTTTDSNGKYVLKLSNKDKEQILKDGFAYIEAERDTKKLRGFILGLTSKDTKYSSNDTYLSHYSEAIFRIKDALGLDLASTKTIYQDFLQSYKKGLYTQDDNTYSFAFRDVIEELALDVKEHLNSNKPLLTKDEVINKIKDLNGLEVDNIKQSNRYSFPLLKIENSSTTLQIISFGDVKATNDFTVTMNRTVNANSIFYDKAVINKFEFSDSDVVLKNVHIKTFDIDKSSGEVLFSEEFKDELKNNQSSQVIKNNRLKLILNGHNIQINYYQKKSMNKLVLPVTEDSTDISYNNENKKAIVKLVIDTNKLNFTDADINLYVNVEVYDNSWYQPDNNSPIIKLKKGENIYRFDFTNLINRFNGGNKHLPIKVTLHENKLGSNQIPLAKCYGFIDWNNDYKNATLVNLTIQETLRGVDTTEYGDNVFINSKGHEAEHINSLTTHRIIDFDKIVTRDIVPTKQTNRAWKDTNYATDKIEEFKESDTRTPLLLIHGWQGDDGLTYPSKLLRYKNSEFEYWHNFISYYLATPKLYNNYKLYTYHYPSYKHITYNARMLKKLFDRVDKNSLLGKAINDKGIVIIGHSMGGLVARSFIEEHKGLGDNAEKLIKLITLDTPHHGSVSSISNYVRTEAGDIFAKDFDTAGAVDLIWDNYDKNYDKDDPHLKAIIDRNNGDSRYKRLHELTNYQGLFDYYYKYGTLNPVNMLTDSNIEMNPYLNSLNQKFDFKTNSFAKEKYIIYTAINIRENENYIVGGISDTIHSEGDDSIYNPIRSNDQMSANTDLINDLKYAGGGAEPVCSSLLSFQTTPDGITRFDESINYNVDNIIPPSKKYIEINNLGDENNNHIPYRIFWDYDHETIMNGQIPKGDTDNFIDELLTLNIKQLGKKTNFSDLKDGIGYGTVRGEYIKFATDYLNFGKTDREVNSDISIYESTANPLRMEPVFLVLQKDLLDAVDFGDEGNKKLIANAGEDKVVKKGESVTLDGSKSSDSDGIIVSYEWKKDGQILATTAIFDYIPIEVGTDILTLTVMDNDGETSSDSVRIEVSATTNIPFIKVTMPNGGQKWKHNSTHTIQWKDNISENVRIELWEGNRLETYISSSTFSDGSFTWHMTSGYNPSNNYKIKIVSIDDKSIFDKSDSSFSILEEGINNSNKLIDKRKFTDNGHIYYLYDTSFSWKESKEFCENNNLYLITITSENENNFIKSWLSTNHIYWLGATDETIEGNWKWITGESWNYTYWQRGEPNDYGSGEDYAYIHGGVNFKWNDVPNDSTVPLSLCESTTSVFQN